MLLRFFVAISNRLLLCCAATIRQFHLYEVLPVSLAIFDLDNTLIDGDSDHAWNEFLIERELVDAEHYRTKNDQFYEDYKQGKLDIYEYLNFALEPLSRIEPTELEKLHQAFMAEKIEPLVLKKAEALVEQHRSKGDTLLIITATNSFVTTPIAKRYGIDNILASDPEVVDGKFTGGVAGTPCYQDGKVTRLEQWLQEKAISMEGSFFYSDSHNDIPLLSKVDNPVAVDADEYLQSMARRNNWPIISLKDEA